MTITGFGAPRNARALAARVAQARTKVCGHCQACGQLFEPHPGREFACAPNTVRTLVEQAARAHARDKGCSGPFELISIDTNAPLEGAWIVEVGKEAP